MTPAQAAPKPASKGLVVSSAVIGALFLVLLAYAQRDRILNGQNDYVQLYTGARLAVTGPLYDHATNNRLIAETIGFTMEGVVYSRPPFYALLLKLLSWLPYRVSFLVFLLVNLAAALWFLSAFRHTAPELPVFAAFSLPLIGSLVNGQDSSLVLALAGASLLLARARRDFTSGVVLSLCAIKFHLFLLVPIGVLACRRWRILQGALAGGAALVLLSFAGGGLTWFSDYLSVLQRDELSPCVDCMPTLRGMFNGAPVWMGAAAAAIGLVLLIARRTHDYELLFAMCILGGLLISNHAYMQDVVLLLLVFAVVLGRSDYVPLRAAAALATTPPVYLMLLSRWPYSIAASATMSVVLALAAYRSLQSNSASERRT